MSLQQRITLLKGVMRTAEEEKRKVEAEKYQKQINDAMEKLDSLEKEKRKWVEEEEKRKILEEERRREEEKRNEEEERRMMEMESVRRQLEEAKEELERMKRKREEEEKERRGEEERRKEEEKKWMKEWDIMQKELEEGKQKLERMREKEEESDKRKSETHISGVFFTLFSSLTSSLSPFYELICSPSICSIYFSFLLLSFPIFIHQFSDISTISNLQPWENATPLGVPPAPAPAPVRTFSTSHFKSNYERVRVPARQFELFQNVHSLIMWFCKKHGIDVQEGENFYNVGPIHMKYLLSLSISTLYLPLFCLTFSLFLQGPPSRSIPKLG